MRLNQEKIERMFNARGSMAGGGGGGSESIAGLASQVWTEENYVSKAFFNELFVIHKKTTTTVYDGDVVISTTVDTSGVFSPNEVPSQTESTDAQTGYRTVVETELDNIEAKKGLWTDYFLSALGLNSSGGGGGSDTLAGLLDVELDSPVSNQVLTYYNGKWRNMSAPGVDMNAVWQALGDTTTTQQIAHSHLTTALNGYATQLWVGQQGFLTSTDLSGYATQTWVTNNFSTPTTVASQLQTYAKIQNGTITIGDASLTPITSVSGTFWGNSWTNGGTVTGSLTSVVQIDMTGHLVMHSGGTGIYLNSDGTGIDWHNAAGEYVSSLIAFTSAQVQINQDLYIPSPKIIRIGDAVLVWDGDNNALKLRHASGANASVNFYATGGVSALGYGDSGGGGGGGDVTWDLLANNTDTRPIALSHLTGALAGYATTSQLAGYLPLIGGTLTGNLSIRPYGGDYADGIRLHARSGDNEWCAVLFCGAENTGDIGTSANSWFVGADNGNFYITRNGTVSGPAGLACVSNAWYINGNAIAVTSQIPTDNNQLTNGAGYITGINSSMITTALGYTPANSTSLANYLPLSGGTLTGRLTVNGGGGRATIHLVSSRDVPNDLYFGSGGNGHWSLTSRDSNDDHIFMLYNAIRPSTVFSVDSYNSVNFTGAVTALSYTKINGTSSQFLKADGSVDENSYALASSLSGYLPLTGGTITGGILSIRPTGGNYADGIRIHARSVDNEWAAIILCGAENTGDTGTSANTWFIGAKQGSLYFGRNGTGEIASHDASFSCVSNTWYINGNAIAVTSQIPTDNNQLTNGAGYVTSSGVTSVATGTGLTGGTITSTGTISINSTYQTYISHGESAYNSLSNYLPLTGGTLTGNLYLHASNDRSRIYLVTQINDACDFWLGANSLPKWNFTCRGSSESYNLDFYSDTASTINGGHVVVFNTNGRAHFYNSIHAALHLCVGSDLGTYDGSRAELDICTPSDNASELWYGVGGSRKWSVCCRGSSESYILAWYTILNYKYAATLTHNGDLSLSGGLQTNGYAWVCVNSGNMGVGTTSPSYKLHVAGTIYSTTDITANNALYVGQGIILNPAGAATTNGGFLDFRYAGAGSYTSRIIEDASGRLYLSATNGVRIGDAVLRWESGNNALRIESPTGGAVNLYTTGGLSALGISGAVDGTINASLIPSVTGTYTLGSTSYGWKELRLASTNGSYNGRIYVDYDGINLDSANGGWFGGSRYMMEGRLVIGTQDDDQPNYDLYVAGNTYVDGTNAYFYGNVSVQSLTQRSDMRIKDVISDMTLKVSTIAQAPLFKYKLKQGDGTIMVGSSAQYWDALLPEVIHRDAEGILGLDYGVTALASVISVAKEVTEHERRIARLEAENAILRAQIEDLKAA